MNKNQMKSELIDKFIDTNNLNNKIFTNKNNKSEFINVINIIKDENIDFNKLIAIYNTSDNKRVLFFEEYFVLFFENKLDKVITYKELQNLEKDKNMIVITLNSTTLKLTDDDNINSLYYFLYFILYIYSQINMELISEEDNNEIISKIGGISIGEFQTINKLFDEERFSSRQGHGFAAERANNLFDRLTGKDAKIVGDDNSKNGADRIVNGVEIQSKYCATGSRCVNECFSENGKGEFRYYNKTGQPMKIEVPSDKYEAAVKAMEEKIRRGQVKGVTDPEDAKNIIKKGNFTYEQAKNIAKAGTVESIIYDSINGVIIAS